MTEISVGMEASSDLGTWPMPDVMEKYHIINVNPDNITEHTLFCIKDLKNPGFLKKQIWFREQYSNGLRLKILKDATGNPAGFIEFVPAEESWRPVEAPGYLFIHCIMVYPGKYKNKGYGSALLEACESEAKAARKSGVCVSSSDGVWLANRTLFERHGYQVVDQLGRFQLLAKIWDENASIPKFIDWTRNLSKYHGWHLLYADQCPWHEKAVQAIHSVAEEQHLRIRIKKLTQSRQARYGPSGYGVFTLIRDGRVLADHYLSETRFRNILNAEMQNS